MPLATITLHSPIPVWLVVLLLAGALFSCWSSYSRCSLALSNRLLLWSLRAISLLIITWLLLQPSRRTVDSGQESGIVVLAVDVSASMGETPPGVRTSRSSRAVDFLQSGKLRRQLSDFRKATFTIGRETAETGLPPEKLAFDASRSYLHAGLEEIVRQYRNQNLAAIVLLSDGLDNSGAEAGAIGVNVPVLIPELEDPLETEESGQPDYLLSNVSAPRMMVVNWEGAITAVIRRQNTKGKASLPVTLYQGESPLQTSTLDFGEYDHFREVSFAITPEQVGTLEYSLRITPPEDTRKDNNRHDLLIEVTDPQNRVLYLEGTPRWEFKFFKRALLADPTFRLSAFVRAGQGIFLNFSESGGEAGSTLPNLDAAQLSRHKVLVLGNLQAKDLKTQEWQQIRNFVNNGGGLLLLGGEKAYGASGCVSDADLRPLLPALPEPRSSMREGHFSVIPTAAASAHPAMRNLAAQVNLPTIKSFWSPVKTGEFSTILLSAEAGSPVLAVRRYGQGRVAMVLSDSLWRWQLGTNESDGGAKNPYSLLMTQLTLWLAPSRQEVENSELLQVLMAENKAEPGEELVIGALLAGTQNQEGASQLQCTITMPDKRKTTHPMVPARLGQEVGLNRSLPGYRHIFQPDQTGRYQISVSDSRGTQTVTKTLVVSQFAQEKTGALLNRPFLEQLAHETHGKLYPWKDRFQLARDIVRTPRQALLTREYPIWNRAIWLVLLIALFSLEWWWRRRLDLV
jgi:hypothetical protein